MGRLGIPVWCHEWMADLNWLRTDFAPPSRGGSVVTSFDLNDVPDDLTTEPPIDEDALWANLESFLRKVLPVAERAGVKLSIIRPPAAVADPGVGRIMRSLENFERLLEIADSPMNTITLCQGNFTLMTDDLPAAIRTMSETPRRELARQRFPGVPIRGDLPGRSSFMTSAKAERLLGWVH